MRLPRLFLPFVTATISVYLAAPSSVSAQEDLFCSSYEIDDALYQLECIADGAYISPESAADQVAEQCIDAPNEKKCRACFNRGRAKFVVAFKALVKVKLLDRSVLLRLRPAFDQAARDTCTDLDSPPPAEPDPAEPAPPANPTPPSYETPAPQPNDGYERYPSSPNNGSGRGKGPFGPPFPRR